MSIRFADRTGRAAPAKPTRRSRPALVKAAARTTTHLTDHEHQLNGEAIETFASQVGGREKLRQVLSIAGAETATEKVITCLLDPAFNSWSLRHICAHAGITVADLFAHYKKALFAAAHIRAAHLITDRLPPIVEDVMARALPREVECPRCKAEPTTPGTSPCPSCSGTGKVMDVPELQRQKLALELGRLIERKGGIVMEQNVIAAAATTALTSANPGSLEQLQQAVGDLLFSPARRRALAPVVNVGVQDPREPAHPQTEPPLDRPLPAGEPQDPEDPSDEDDEDEDEEPLNA